jgi:three-Cys-motif partner protein
MPELLAQDGLRARDNGPWGRQKLSYIDAFAPPALLATERKRSRWYVDLFAGPGMNVERGSGAEFRGSPLRALFLHAKNRPDLHFTDAVFVNYMRRDHDALLARVDRAYDLGGCVIPRDRILVINADANDYLPELFRRIHPEAYVFAFADIEAPRQWPWTSVRALREQGHRSVDLYTLFPLDMAIVRLCAYRESERRRLERRLTEYFGTDEWKQFADLRTDAQSQALRNGLTELYLRQLKTLWSHAEVKEDVKRTRRHALYKMLFASNHPAGERLSRWYGKGEDTSGQLDLF